MIVNKPMQIAATIEKGHSNSGRPPLEKWNPSNIGEIDIRIAKDGSWYHEGSRINRIPLVQLFASVLLKENQNYFLVTPEEKVKITVDDAPFHVVWFEQHPAHNDTEQVALVFRTSLDEVVTADKEHAIRVIIDPETQEPSPYIHVRNNLDALISRAVFYQLVDIAVEKVVDGKRMLGLESAGEFFPIDEVPDS